MARGSDRNTKKGFPARIWKWLRRIFLWIFIFQLFYIILLKWVNPPITITQFVSWISGHGLKRDYVNRHRISPYAGWKSIRKAMAYNKRKPGRIHGGSTISQQVAKNVFLWQGKSWIRKGLEAYFTFMIELIWGKKRILEVYLNVIEMGEGIFGIEAASEYYFGKTARNLSQREAALIAACLPSPRRYKVKPLSAFVSSRALAIERQMANLHTDRDIQRVTGLPPP